MTNGNGAVASSLGLPGVSVGGLGSDVDQARRRDSEAHIIERQPEEFFSTEACVDQRGNHRLELRVIIERL